MCKEGQETAEAPEREDGLVVPKHTIFEDHTGATEGAAAEGISDHDHTRTNMEDEDFMTVEGLEVGAALIIRSIFKDGRKT